MSLKVGHHRLSLACRWWPIIEFWLCTFVALWFLGAPDQYCQESLYFCDFSEGGPDHLCPPLDPAMSLLYTQVTPTNLPNALMLNRWLNMKNLKLSCFVSMGESFQDNPEPRILMLTYHRKSVSKCWIKQIKEVSPIIFQYWPFKPEIVKIL